MASLTTIREDDIVEVDVKGRRAIAFVAEKRGRKLKIRAITPNFTWTEVTGHQVLRHWRKTKNTQQRRGTAHDDGDT